VGISIYPPLAEEVYLFSKSIVEEKAMEAGPARTLGKIGWRGKGDFGITEPDSIGGS
jgi:hypothetical protein